MYDVNADAKGRFRRIEVLTGPGRRRRWSADEKAQIIEETLAPGARVSEVARRWQVSAQQVFGWRREARNGGALTAAAPPLPSSVPVVTEPAPSAPAPPAAPVIEIRLAGAVVRVVSGIDGALLTTVLQAVRASASRP